MKAFARLDGMFALAVWDKAEERELVLARDRSARSRSTGRCRTAYSSSVQNSRRFGNIRRFSKELDPRSLAHYLAREYVPTPRSIYKDIRKLMPGSSLRLREGSVTQERFWKARHGAPSGPVRTRGA